MPHMPRHIDILNWSWGLTQSGPAQFDGQIVFNDGLTFDFTNSPTPAIGLAAIMPLEHSGNAAGIEEVVLAFEGLDHGHQASAELTVTTSDGTQHTTTLTDPTVHDIQVALAGDALLT